MKEIEDLDKIVCLFCKNVVPKDDCHPTEDGNGFICDFCVERFNEPDCRDEADNDGEEDNEI